MKHTDKRVDTYIGKAEPFAKPILDHLRKLVHKSCPEVTETIKWGFPHFEYKGMLCFLASFKTHCTFGFWRGDLLKDLREKANTTGEKGMGQFGRISTLKDLPSDTQIKKWILEAVQLNENADPKIFKKKVVRKNILKVPEYFVKTLNTNKKATANFFKLSPAQQNEYVEWITEAKTETTQMNRIKSMIEWVKENKPRNWKYMEKYK